MESPSDDESESFDLLTAKQTLVNGLIKFADTDSDPLALSELEKFVSDIENILKVLTFKETVLYLLPSLDMFLDEPEYLKVELFRHLPSIFKKLLKSPARASIRDSVELITNEIFPLIAQFLMTSDSEVQEQGVIFLKQISHPVTGFLE